MKISKQAATVIIILVGILAVFLSRSIINAFAKPVSRAALSRTLGSPRAPTHIIEYLDFQCPACAKGSKILKGYLKKYPSQFYLEVKYFPLSNIHRYGLTSALYAECAARQNKFWPFENLLIERQSQWGRLLDAASAFKGMAQESGIDLKQLDACVNNEKTRTSVLKEKEEGKAQGVQSTPTYFINGKIVVGATKLAEELPKFLGQAQPQSKDRP